MEQVVVLSSVEFIFRFLPIFLAVYLLTPVRYRTGVLFMGSLIFYACGQPIALLLLLGLTIVNYILGTWVWGHRGTALLAAISIDVCALLVCKILALTVSMSLLPLGMSFYIFKMISYQADLWQERIRRRPTFVRTAAYFMMFPQVTQGPIMRYSEGHFGEKGALRVTRAHFEEGLVYVVIGLFLKVALADRIGILWNEILKIGYESISAPLAWMGAYAYSAQLYYDFWGYSLIAAGVSMMLGFDFIENFAHPYAATSISEFYRRWHATLGSWFRDYIYIPMGGSRQGALRTACNLMVVWLITGFWHGGTWNYVLWGLVLGVIIVLEKFVPIGGLVGTILGRIRVLVVIPLTWVIFAITDGKSLGLYFARLFPIFGIGAAADPSDYLRFGRIYWPLFVLSGILLIPGIFKTLVRHRRNPLVLILLTAAFWYAVYYMVTSAGNSFLYFSF